MAPTGSEKYRTVSGDADSREVGWVVTGAANDTEALEWVRDNAPQTLDQMPLDNVRIDEVTWPDKWDCIAVYSRRSFKRPNTNETEFQFELSLTNQRIYQSRATVGVYGESENYGNAINVDEDGKAQGADIRTPVSSFSITWFPSYATVTPVYQRNVQFLVGKVNSLPFQGFAAGEVMFVGANGRIRSRETDWEITYRFEVSENQTNLSIGPITGVNVGGWEYMWVRYAEDVGANRYVPKPVQVNVERVYDLGDLNYLFTG